METNTSALSGLEPLLSIEELSEYLNVPIRTLYDWRLAGKGPCAVHVGRQFRYFVSDVHDWLRNQRGGEGSSSGTHGLWRLHHRDRGMANRSSGERIDATER